MSLTADRLNLVLAATVAWAAQQSDIVSLALVGSCARGTWGPDSDIDLLLLTADSTRLRHDKGWVEDIDWSSAGLRPTGWKDADYGAVWSLHLHLEPVVEVEFGFAPLAWAATAPIDPGTLAVARAGCRVLLDRDGNMEALLAAADISQ